MRKKIYFLIVLCLALNTYAQDIATARMQGLGAVVTISGIVTNGDELGPIRYIEDNTAGLALYDLSTNNHLANTSRGDSITVSGTLVDYNGLLELNTNAAAVIHSSNNLLPTPQVITPLQANESTESELVQIDNAIFTSGGSSFTVGTHDFISNGETGKIYVRTGHPLENTLIPVAPVTIIGISSQYTFSIPANDGYQILPRDSADVILPTNIIFTSSVTQSNITNNGFDLSWTTSMNGNTNCNYGTTNSLGTIINNGGSTTSHTLTLTGLQPATIYYAQCFSVDGTDTAFSNIRAYVTKSNSSGKIKPYFNHSVDHSVSTGLNAENITTYFNDTIKAYMDRATSTLDVCVYNASDATLASAINDAYNRGVSVRYIADDDALNSMLSSLDPNIPVVYRNPNTAGIMHNKFIIIDANSTDNAWVMGGSCNWTNPSNLFNDYNNIIFIQDEALAKAYTLEFNEMWSGVFGTHKEDNTPHKFNINGIDVELYFSPSDQTTSHIMDFINSVDYTLEFALLSFTKDELGDAVEDVNSNFGVNVRGIIEQANINGSEFSDMVTAGVNVKSHTGVTHQLHHKYAIADANVLGSNPTVLTGSHNWSANAENNSDENTLIIYDHAIANIYLQEFTERFNELNTSAIDESIDLKLTLFPNPSKGFIQISSESEIKYIKLYSTDGSYIKTIYSPIVNINTSGIYFLKVVTKQGSVIRKVVIN